MLISNKVAKGFTLIEIMVALAIVAILFLLTAPSYGTYVNNSRIRAQAQNFAADLQLARVEAIRRNLPATLMLTNRDPIDNNKSFNPDMGGKNWIVRTCSFPIVITGAPGDCIPEFIRGKSAKEGNASSIEVKGVGGAQGSPEVSHITFDGMGRINAASSVDFRFFNSTAGACKTASAPDNPVTCLSVIVSVGGKVQICDPSVAVTAVGDTRRCK